MTPHHASEATLALCHMAPVIPVLVIHDPAHARHKRLRQRAACRCSR